MCGSAWGGVRKCNTVYDQKCWDEPRQKCSDVQKPYEETVYDQKCHTEYDQKCNTVYDTKVTVTGIDILNTDLQVSANFMYYTYLKTTVLNLEQFT